MTLLASIPKRFVSWNKVLVALAILALVLGWLGQFVRERFIVASLRAKGAEVGYHCGHAATVFFPSGSSFADADMELVTAFRDLESVDLTYTQVTVDGVAQLGNSTRLRSLTVLVKQITDRQEETLKRDNARLSIEKLWLDEGTGMRIVDGFQ